MMEQQVLSLVGETQLVVFMKLEGYDMHFEELMVVYDRVVFETLVGMVVDDEVLHKLVSMVEKNELFEELMIVVVDTEHNLTEFDKEILEFLRFLGHSAQIKTLTDVNVNKLYQPWRSFVAVINKCMTGKSTSFDSLRLSQAQFLCGLYHKRNKPSIPRRNNINWHYVRDDILFSTIKVEYYACTTREAAPKPKASARKKKGGSASSTTPPTPIATPTPTKTVVAAPRLSATAKGKQPARARSPTEPSDVERTQAEQLNIVLRRSRHEMHISQQ
nr:hypothetical protein [Tanacetum cinerariifolium]